MKAIGTALLLVLLFSGCSREAPKPPAAAPASRSSPQPLNAGKPAEVLNEPKAGESEAEANMRGMLRMDGHACDRIVSMEGGEQGGRVVCAAGDGTVTYQVDTKAGRFTKQ